MSFGSAASANAFPRVAGGDPCPCGGGRYDGCCGPLLAGRPAPSAERLMRSRYTAFVVGDRDHLLRSWHPATRPDDLALDPDMRWRGLTIVFAEEDAAGGSGVVRFRARWSAAGENGVLEERSRFARRAGRWVYLDGEVS